MVKVVYIWPGDVRYREWFSDRETLFSTENNRTVDVSRDLMYDLIAAERIGMYMKIEWDPKAIPRSTFTDPGVRQMNQKPKAPNTIIVDDGMKTKEVPVDDVIDDLLAPVAEPAQEIANPCVGTTEPAQTPVESNVDELLNTEAPKTIVADVVDETNVQSTLSW